MKSIGTDPANHAAEGDERIRTAVPDGTNETVYERALREIEALAECVDPERRDEDTLDAIWTIANAALAAGGAA